MSSITPAQTRKLQCLKKTLADTGGCAIAYSGGVDSTFLVAVAREVLGDRCLAVLATSSTYPKREFQSAVKWLEDNCVPHVIVHSEELDIPGFSENPPDRCYFCKKELFAKVREEAHKRGLKAVADGANADDTGDFRPGMAAAKEMGVMSPLKDCELTKADIRHLSREVYNLPTSDKPSMACMSSRFPYGSRITREKLKQVEAVEDFLFEKGFRTMRARHHGELVRLELGEEEMLRIRDDELRTQIIAAAKQAGFTYVTLDLQGFRSGAMNEVL